MPLRLMQCGRTMSSSVNQETPGGGRALSLHTTTAWTGSCGSQLSRYLHVLLHTDKPCMPALAKGAQTPTKRVIEEGDLSLELHPTQVTEQALP